MNDVKGRLIQVFEAVFPKMPRAAIPAAAQNSVESWDSVAAITLINVIEEEFQIQMDFEDAAELTSFAKILAYLERRVSHTAA
ncbi:MAG TPA: acyl carrier protein [Bryobacteraceae bacterium]|jgi:acyl carrier protein|nr:acyl carrier protein [Bryobacteraceae bacterium]